MIEKRYALIKFGLFVIPKSLFLHTGCMVRKNNTPIIERRARTSDE